ncbi:hypothetical protein [Dyella sp.]|uniref:hypothetical protein n=1 Tax=Dyella sp. TaxID=1869338 RepID=UPI002ED32BAB
MSFAPSRLLLIFLLLAEIGLAASAHADTCVKARQMAFAGMKFQDIQAQLGEDGSGGIRLAFHVGKADIPVMGWRKVGVTLRGTLQRDAELRWLFAGGAQLANAPGGALSDAKVAMVIDDGANTLQIDLTQGQAQVSGALPLDQPSHAQINLNAMPAGWLQGLLATVWSGRTTSGRINADVALDTRDEGIQASGQFSLDGIGFDTPGGRLAGQQLGGGGRLSVDTTGPEARLGLDASLRGGDILLGPLFARLPADHPVQVGIDARSKHGNFVMDRLRVTDADALQLEGSLGFDGKGDLQTLRLDRFQARFPAAYTRYGQSWLAALGLRDMRVQGQVNGMFNLDGGTLKSFSFDTDGLDAADAEGRLAVAGLRGGMDWAAQGDRPPTTLGWRNLDIYRIANGAAQAHWQSRNGTMALQRPLDVPVLGGKLHVGEFAWRPAAGKGERLNTSLVLTGIDMAAFSRAVGWPEFSGTLGGAIPGLRWVDDRFELEGGLTVNVFDGFVEMTRLSLQQPFGPTPVFSGNVRLSRIDLGALTSVFDFGSITGRMDGSIDQLRLVNWNPVAFKASLLAPDGGKISQRAVNNLTSVGGGGLASGLQGAVLRIFKTFSYKRIGLNCTLEGSLCHMGGLDRDGDSYTILEGSGLPRLQVVGHQTQVDWPTLVRRLKAATEGAAPEVH